MKSRPVQYLGLALLVLACLAVIFLPIGARPQAQPFSLRVEAPQPFTSLVGKGKTPVDVADEAFATLPQEQTIPTGFQIEKGGKTAIIEDQAATQDEARARADQLVKVLNSKFKGVRLAPDAAQFANLPTKPLFALGDNFAVYPPRTRDGVTIPAVKLGLDLQGGVNLVLQVRRALFPFKVAGIQNTPEAREATLAKVRAALASSDENGGLREADVAFNARERNQIDVRTQARDRAQFNAQTGALNALMKGIAGAQITPARAPQFFEVQTQSGQDQGYSGTDYNARLLDNTVEIIRARVDKLGVSEPQIQKQEPDRVIVQLPGVADPEEAVRVIGQTAQMEIRLLPLNLQPQPDPSDPNNTLFLNEKGALVSAADARRESTPVVSGVDVKPTTSAGFIGGGEPALFFELQGQGSKVFADVTREAAAYKARTGQPRYIPVFLEDRCITAPSVESAITGGSGQISGGFKTIEEAQELALLLNSGALPAPIDVVENRTVSATLGNDSLVKSLRAGLIGLIAVAFYMVAYYRLPGLMANAALLIYMVLNLAVFVLVGGTLTLPGIAGSLLALAMSLDTNILVFERLREEMAIQPTFAAALRAAFSRAWTAILDSHVTTLIAATVLFYFGTGPVKGFALTLAIGVLLSLFSAIVVTRLFMWSIAGTGERNRRLFGGKAVAPTTETVLAK